MANEEDIKINNEIEKKRKIVLDFIGEEDKNKKNIPPDIDLRKPRMKAQKVVEDKKNILDNEEMKKAKIYLGLEKNSNKIYEKVDVSKDQKIDIIKEAVNESKPIIQEVLPKKTVRKKRAPKKNNKKPKTLKKKNSDFKKSLKSKKIQSKNKNNIKQNIFLIIALAILAYLAFSFLALNFNFKNLSNASKYVPVPAVISRAGIINSYSVDIIKAKEGNYQENIFFAIIFKKIAKENGIDYRKNYSELKQSLIDNNIMTSEEIEAYKLEKISNLKILFLK
jgi:uncharacterized protein with PQ loop repeat